MQDSWNRKVYTIRYTKIRERQLSDLIDLVDKETVLANDRLFSRGGVSHIYK